MKRLIRFLHEIGLGRPESEFWHKQAKQAKELIKGMEFSTYWNAQQLIDDLKIAHNQAAARYNKCKFWFEKRINLI